VGNRSSILAQATEHFHEHGYAVLPGYLCEDDLAPAQAELELMFPTAEDYHAGADPARNARFTGGAFAGIDPFPYSSVEWSLLGLSPPIAALAEALLGTAAIRLYEAHNWAKYSGATDYDQQLHCDYGNHTPVVPSDDPSLAEVEMFIYIHGVPEELGPTHVVSQHHTRDFPMWPPRITREEHPEIYTYEVSTAGPAGTVLAYKTSTYHRGTAMSASGGARFSLKASYRTVSDIWFDKMSLTERLGESWYRFVEQATPRQLELVGFPPRGHRYWTSRTWSDVCHRYPDADLSAFRPQQR
jgi:ectoine hydroxylase-related dioxygenase (phytanoyl-CoA dioxygenase family)